MRAIARPFCLLIGWGRAEWGGGGNGAVRVRSGEKVARWDTGVVCWCGSWLKGWLE